MATQQGTRIKQLLLEGYSYSAIRRECNVASSTIAYHARVLGLAKRSNGAVRYNWEQIQQKVDEGSTVPEIRRLFGCSSIAVSNAIQTGKLKLPSTSRLNRISLKDILVECSSYTAIAVLKRRLVEEGLLKYMCYNNACPLFTIEHPKWATRPIVLHLDHINGVRDDHRLQNLRFLCPNCHSQTDTYCGKNVK